jgi:hypothetical protein
MTVALSGGTVSSICPVEEARGGAWSEDGTILFAPRPDGPLYRVSSAGGEPSQATALDGASGEITHRWPQFLPGGKAFLFTAHGNAGAAREGDVIVQDASGRRLVHRGGIFARYAASGHLLYVSAGKLFASPFDLGRLEVTGRAVPMVDDVAVSTINGTAQYALSTNASTSSTSSVGARRPIADRACREYDAALLMSRDASQPNVPNRLPDEYRFNPRLNKVAANVRYATAAADRTSASTADPVRTRRAGT